MVGNPYAAYQNASQQNQEAQIPSPGSPTFTEAWALIEAARRMATAIEHCNMEDMKQRNKVRDTVRLNWRLWTLFQAQLTVGDVEVPEDLRNNMLTLAKFVDNHTVETMKTLHADKIAILIDINRNIASGHLDSLNQPSEQPPAEEAPAESSEPQTPTSFSSEA